MEVKKMRLTLYGMTQYDPDLFSGIMLPEGITRSDLVNHIIERSGDLYPYYQVVPRFKILINNFFKRRNYNYNQMAKALNAEYSPIENYDRYEDEIRDISHGGADTHTTSLGSKIKTVNSGNSTDQTVPFPDGSAFTDRAKTINSGQTETENSGSDQDTTAYGMKRDEHTVSHIHGNIGVTTAQQMIEAELNLRMRFDLIDMIASDFEREFLIQLY